MTTLLLAFVARSLAGQEYHVAPNGSIQASIDLARSGDTVYVPAGWSGPTNPLTVGYYDITIAGEDPLNPPVIPSVIAGSANQLTLRYLVIGDDSRSNNADLESVQSDATFSYRVYSLGVDLVLHGVQMSSGEGYGAIAVDASIDAEDVTASGFAGGSALFVAAINSDESLAVRSSTFVDNPAGAVRVDGDGYEVQVDGEALTFSGNGSETAGYGSDLRLESVGSVAITDMISSGAQVSTSAGLGGSVYVYTQAGPLDFVDVLFDSAYGSQGRALAIQGRQDSTEVSLSDVSFQDATGLTSGYGPLYVSFARSVAMDQVYMQDSITTYGAAYLYYVNDLQITDSTFSGTVNFTAAAGGAAVTTTEAHSVGLTRTRICGGTGGGALVKIQGDITVLGLIVSGSYANEAIAAASGSVDVRAATFTDNTFTVADVVSGGSELFARNVLFGDQNTGMAFLTNPSTIDYDYLFTLTDEVAITAHGTALGPGDHPQSASDPDFDAGWQSDCSTFPYVSTASAAYNTGDPLSPNDADGTAPDIGAMSGEAGTWWVDDDAPGGDVSNDTGTPDTGSVDTGGTETGGPDTGGVDTAPDSGAGADWDGDGYFGEDDCDDTARGTHPLAYDIPDDGEDQDCDGADAVSALAGGCGCSAGGSGAGWPAAGLPAVAGLLLRRRRR